MKKAIGAVITALIGLAVIACPILYFLVGPQLDKVQLDTLVILAVIAGASALYCFVVGEIARNNSQMDKLWSILPEVYIWIVAVRGGMTPRLIVMAVLATLWGIRLTFNFARKGAYSLKFWAGEEDYRWKILRARKQFQPRWKWALFNLFFISIYQNALVLATTFPALASMTSTAPFGWIDGIAAALTLFFLVYETIADEQQWAFQTKKWKMIREGKRVEELPAPYNKGFNTAGLWAHSRHPNYFGEQGIWLSLYIFSIGAGAGIFNWSLIGALLLVVLFLGSSAFAESVSRSKYPQYDEYRRQVSKFFPWKKMKEELLVPEEGEAETAVSEENESE